MMTNPFVSIVTVTLNNLSGLQKTATSITSQTFKDFEWIIIDGVSTDGTNEFLKACDAQIISEPDNGLYDAMNKGIDKATGEYLLFLNAGDIFASNTTLDNIYNQANDDTDFIYGDALEIYHGRDIYKHARPHEFALSGMFTHHQSMLYRRATIENLRYNLGYKIAADYDFTLRFLNNVKTIQHIPLPFCLFESGGLSERNAFKGRIEQFRIRKNSGQNFFDNLKVFLNQTMVYSIRCLSPKTYWFLKRFSLRA